MKLNLIPSELTWLYFNQCIVDEAADVTNPLYERIKFMAIFSSNLDEFFRVKVNHLANDKSILKSDFFNTILKEINQQQEQFGGIWRNDIIPELRQNNIIVYEGQKIETFHHKEIERYFKSNILSFVQVVFIQKGIGKIYFLNNRSLYFLVKLKNKEGEFNYAYINIPSDKLNRYKQLQKKGDNNYIISLDEIIKSCLYLIFMQDEIVSCFAIKMNRDEDYEIEDENTGNLIHKIKDKIKERKTGLPTRFLYDYLMPKEEIDFCKETFQLKKSEMVAGGKMHNLFDLFKFPNPVKPNLQSPNFPALEHKAFENLNSIFEVIDTKNQLLHFPYHSYHYVLQFFNQAAIDNRVTEIKVTLYRISTQSLIANALISAAKNGKKVTVFVEVKARFDEDNNLHWANEMKKAGIKIIYSMPNLKVHAKIALVTMQTAKKTTQQYAYLATGNFNENTAAIYADHGFFTSEKKYTDDISKVFRFLKSKEKSVEMDTLLVAGFNMKQQILNLIDTEIQNHKAGKSSGVLLKVNGIDEKDIINKLYEASQVGVKITLLVRGICSLLPEIKGISENIKAYRIVDMFLEHARIYKFNNAGEEKMYLSSADMMGRNLNSRIEVGFPIEDEDLKTEINQIIQFQLEDNTKKRIINSNGKCAIIQNVKNTKRAQVDIYNWLKNK
ncbi:polyphosphate kinase 1 [Flavobacterium soyangense]|uniref:Polyphosphate kinase n=1 Tax=Flavobacterium soyangense TaxID=2023265 RepID=A0A930Y1G1_9FLAO|nr:polyphosphate kinase 1 [Flavobacterium soyangense]MBF2709444.1 polyphosphate kinase 1 [Flavobacterium soyangense]